MYAASCAKAGVNNISDLTEEVAANAAESLMKSESFVENLITDKDFIENIVKTKSKSFVQRVMERLRSIISAVKQYLNSADVNHKVAETLSKDVNELEKIEKLWANAFKAAAENRAEVQSIAKENTDTEGSGGKYSLEEDNSPITVEDVKILRSIGRKSINEFTPEDIKKSEKWARKFYSELGVKSPFFRAWFGDWRAKDSGNYEVIKSSARVYSGAGRAHNFDMNRDISWGMF